MSGIVKESQKIGGTNGSSPINNMGKDVDKLSPKIQSLGEKIKKTFDLYILYRFARAVVNIVGKSIKEMSDFIENYNLFRVSMGSMADDATRFQNAMNEAFGTDLSQAMRYQGFFQNLTTSLGIVGDTSLVLSENLTKLTYDLSSLFNVPFEDIYTKLQSGIIGQTKPLRALGIDVTMQTLQPYLDEMGINKQVTQLTQAEKVLLRYISILKQSGNAQGDFARTIEQPANQMKVFGNQVKEITRWFGALFIQTFANAMPYINGVAMALKEIMKFTALLMGFELPDLGYDDMGADAEEAEEGVEGLTSAMKRQLRAFDEINNITSATSGSTPLGDTSTYNQLLEYITDYNNKMEQVRMRALEIRDAILKWAGYVRDADGNLKIVDGTLASGVQKFTENLKLMISDALQWIKDNPDTFDAIIEFAKIAGLMAAQIWLFYNPLALIPLAIGAIVYFYDDIKKFWEALTPSQKLITSLLMLAGAVSAVWIASSAGAAAVPIGLGIAAVLGTLGVAGLISSSAMTKETKAKTDPYSYDNTYNSAERWQRTTHTPEYADGGFPTTGQMFIARESGAEMVGSIGGRTAVANNDQIVQGIANGVYEGMVSAMRSSNSKQPVNVTVQIGGTQLPKAVIDIVNDGLQQGYALSV